MAVQGGGAPETGPDAGTQVHLDGEEHRHST
jgi:hypothetical protein